MHQTEEKIDFTLPKRGIAEKIGCLVSSVLPSAITNYEEVRVAQGVHHASAVEAIEKGIRMVFQCSDRSLVPDFLMDAHLIVDYYPSLDLRSGNWTVKIQKNNGGEAVTWVPEERNKNKIIDVLHERGLLNRLSIANIEEQALEFAGEIYGDPEFGKAAFEHRHIKFPNEEKAVSIDMKHGLWFAFEIVGDQGIPEERHVSFNGIRLGELVRDRVIELRGEYRYGLAMQAEQRKSK